MKINKKKLVLHKIANLFNKAFRFRIYILDQNIILLSICSADFPSKKNTPFSHTKQKIAFGIYSQRTGSVLTVALDW